MFTETTASITVSVEPSPLDDASRPHEGVFAFAYSVNIENHSGDTVQLLERHWIIEAAGQPTGEVTGSGVVGQQPIIQPGESFQYTSSTVICEPVGSMRGTYIFRRKEGGFFTVQIPRFNLFYPILLN